MNTTVYICTSSESGCCGLLPTQTKIPTPASNGIDASASGAKTSATPPHRTPWERMAPFLFMPHHWRITTYSGPQLLVRSYWIGALDADDKIAVDDRSMVATALASQKKKKNLWHYEWVHFSGPTRGVIRAPAVTTAVAQPPAASLQEPSTTGIGVTAGGGGGGVWAARCLCIPAALNARRHRPAPSWISWPNSS